MSIEINDVTPTIRYVAAAGQTTFAIPFEFFADGDIVAEKNGVALTLAPSPGDSTEYSLTGAGQTGGGSLTLGGGAALNDDVLIYRDMPIERTTDYPLVGPFQVEALNTDLDKAVAMMQQLERDNERSLKVPQGETGGELPAAATRANRYPVFDANGDLTTSAGTGADAGLRTDMASTDASKGVDLVAGAAKKIANRTAIKALTSDGDKARPLHLEEAGREGVFVWDASDRSAEVSADTQEGIYVAPTSDATGASGAWVRQYKGPIKPSWFGANPVDFTDVATDHTAAFQAMNDLAYNTASGYANQLNATNGLKIELTRPDLVGRRRYNILSTLTINCDNLLFEGGGMSTEIYVGSSGAIEIGEGTDTEDTGSNPGNFVFIKSDAPSYLHFKDINFSGASSTPNLVNVKAVSFISFTDCTFVFGQVGVRLGSAQWVNFNGHYNFRNQRDCCVHIDGNGVGLGHVHFNQGGVLGYSKKVDTDSRYGAHIVINRYDPSTVSGLTPPAGSFFGSLTEIGLHGCHLSTTGTDTYGTTAIKCVGYNNPNDLTENTLGVVNCLTIDGGTWFEGPTELITSTGSDDKVDLISFNTLSNGNMRKGVTLTGVRATVNVVGGTVRQWHGDTIYTVSGASGTVPSVGDTITDGTNSAEVRWVSPDETQIAVTTQYTVAAGKADARFAVSASLTSGGYSCTVDAVENTAFIVNAAQCHLGDVAFTDNEWNEYNIVNMANFLPTEISYAKDYYGFGLGKGLVLAYENISVAVAAVASASPGAPATLGYKPTDPDGDDCWVGSSVAAGAPSEFSFVPRNWNPGSYYYEGASNASIFRMVWTAAHGGGNTRVRFAY